MRSDVRSVWIALALLLGGAGAASAQWSIDGFLPSHGGRIGLRVEPMTPELREFMKAPKDRGVLVVQVEPERPAARAGIRVGDVVTAAGGEPVERPFDLVKAVAGPAEGESLAIEVYRDGEKRTLEIEPEGDSQPWVDPDEWKPWLERHMRRGSEELRRELEEFERRIDKLEQEHEEERKRLEKQGST
jgi:membrane-associated protease RseP (regulator of RpoE activity)